MKTVKITTSFEAFDGTVFDNRKEAIAYERTAKATKNAIAALTTVVEDAGDFFSGLVDSVNAMDAKAKRDFLNGLRFLTVERKAVEKKEKVVKEKKARKTKTTEVAA
jgi:hypothetical protein